MIRPALCVLFCAVTPAFAHDPTIKSATAAQNGTTWSFSVTLEHEEVGWDDYADGWRVESHAGDVFGTRVLHHPHANEQPFMRSLSGVELPGATKEVWIRARTSADGWGEDRYHLELQ